MGLKLSELPTNEEIFIDANIFLYSAFKHPVLGDKCKNFLIGIEKGEIKGYTSDFVLNEVFHKLMIAEVVKKFWIAAKQVVRFVKKKCYESINTRIWSREKASSFDIRHTKTVNKNR